MGSEKIEFFRHNLTEEDIARAAEVMRSIILTTGPQVAEFEKKFAGYLGAGEVVGLTSCTGAIRLALERRGIGPGDEVITTPMTFVATAAAVIETGAVPVFVDVCRRSGLMTPENAKQAITERTKAILPVHLYGRMVDMKGFAKLARENGLALIEDAAHCIEGSRDGIRPGELGDAACFSFYATKGITCGEGGALACDSAEDAGWYRSARHHGISKNASYRYTRKYEHWDMEMMGWKYNMDDIQAALLLGQIDRLDDYRERRREIEETYRGILEDIAGLEFIEPPGVGEKSGHHLFTVLVPAGKPRDAVLYGLQKEGIGCAVNYRAVHNLTYFKERFGFGEDDFPAASEIGGRTVSLPIYPKLADREVRRVCETLRSVIASL